MALSILAKLADIRRDLSVNGKIRLVRTFTDKCVGHRKVKTFVRDGESARRLNQAYAEIGLKAEVYGTNRPFPGALSGWYVIVRVPAPGIMPARTLRAREAKGLKRMRVLHRVGTAETKFWTRGDVVEGVLDDTGFLKVTRVIRKDPTSLGRAQVCRIDPSYVKEVRP